MEMDEATKAALAAKGYDIVGEADSDSDGGMPGRIPSLEPNVAREKGKKAFQEGKYDKAIKYWQGGLKSILSALCAGPHALGDQSLSELDLTLNLNIAMAYMKKEDYDMADRSVDKALARREALAPQLVVKALYRKASAQRAMHKLDECLVTLKDMLEVEPGNTAALQMQQEVDREWKMQCQKQKRNLKKMFDQMSGEDKKEEERLRKERAEARERCAVRWVAGEDVDSAAFEAGEAPACSGGDWGLALTRTVLWSVEQLAVDGACCLSTDVSHVSAWFLGASSTCELRWLQPSSLLKRLPSVKTLELSLVGFLGELSPENKREPDPKADSLPLGSNRSKVTEDQEVILRVVKGTLAEALEKEFKQPPAGEEADKEEKTEEGAEEEAEPAFEQAAAAPARAGALAAQVPPSICFIAHPQLHRYYSDFYPAIAWLIDHRVPTVIIGASDPDPSWEQDEVLLKALGCNIVVSKRESPYPMCLPDNPKVKKCNHIIAFLGGKAIERDKLVKTKLDLLAKAPPSPRSCPGGRTCQRRPSGRRPSFSRMTER